MLVRGLYECAGTMSTNIAEENDECARVQVSCNQLTHLTTCPPCPRGPPRAPACACVCSYVLVHSSALYDGHHNATAQAVVTTTVRGGVAAGDGASGDVHGDWAHLGAHCSGVHGGAHDGLPDSAHRRSGSHGDGAHGDGARDARGGAHGGVPGCSHGDDARGGLQAATARAATRTVTGRMLGGAHWHCGGVHGAGVHGCLSGGVHGSGSHVQKITFDYVATVANGPQFSTVPPKHIVDSCTTPQRDVCSGQL